MKLLQVEVRNVLKVADAHVDTSGHHLFLVGGKNSNGKSSFLTALACALCGKRAMGDAWPDVLLKEGEKEGMVRVNLSGDAELHDDQGFVVEMMLRRKRGGVVADEIRVLDSTGEEASEPRDLLSRLYNMKAFDPLAFERTKSKDRAELLRQLVGLDFTELDERRKTAYASRTVVNSEGKAKKAQLDAIEVPDDTPDEPLSVGELFRQLEEAQVFNRTLKQRRDNAAEAATAIRKEQDSLVAEREKIRERLLYIDGRLQTIGDEAEDFNKAVADTMAEEFVDESGIKFQIESADEINRTVAAKKQRNELDAVVKDLRGKSQKLSDEITAIDQEKHDRLENAAWPLPSLSLDESGVLLNGLPFEQASKAERVLASVKVGMALNPKLRLLICEDGNDLDNETMAALDAVLKENDFQMLLEYVTRSEADEARCAVVFHEGSPKTKPETNTSNPATVTQFDDQVDNQADGASTNDPSK